MSARTAILSQASAGVWTAINRTRSVLRGRRIYFALDSAGWAVDQCGYRIAESLRKQVNAPVCCTRQPMGLKGQIIQHNDPYGFFRLRLHHSLCKDNAVFLTWPHHDPNEAASYLEEVKREAPRAADILKKVIPTCEATRTALLEVGVAPERMEVIPLGADLEGFWPCPSVEQREALRKDLGIAPGAIAIGSFQKDGVGWGEGNEPKLIKGPDIFLGAIELLVRRKAPIHVLLTGPARGYVIAGLRRMNVPFTHRLLPDPRSLNAMYHALDLYIIASRCEGGPFSLLESWATGTPLVSTRMGMPADHIRHGENGLLAEVENCEQLAECAEALAADERLRERVVQNGLRDVQKLSWDVLARRYFDELYAPVLRE